MYGLYEYIHRLRAVSRKWLASVAVEGRYAQTVEFAVLLIKQADSAMRFDLSFARLPNLFQGVKS
jgi:hypothetical protein